MKLFTCTIDGRLPGLNEMIDAARTDKHVGAAQKKEFTELCMWEIKATGCPKNTRFTSRARVGFKYFEPNMMRDPDNIEACRKFILDALVKTGVIKGDSWRYLAKHNPFYTPEFRVDRDNPRIEVTVLGFETEGES